MRNIGAFLAGLAATLAATGLHAQQVTGQMTGTSPGSSAINASFTFECTGNDPCTGSYRGVVQPHECSNFVSLSGPLSVTGGMVPAVPGPVTLTLTFTNDFDDMRNPDGTCTFVQFPGKPFSKTLAGRWDGQQGTVTTFYVDGDGFTENLVATYTVSAPAPFQMTVTSSVNSATASATASVQFASSLVGTTQSVYVFALAPPSMVKRTSAAKVDATLPCVLAQLNGAGQLVAVSAASLQAYVTGVINAGAQAYTILNNVPTVNIGGATFMLGVGQTGASAIASNATRAAITVPGTVSCKAEKPQTGWWWNDKEGGRGFSIEARGNNLFFAGYLYDAAGQATWLAAVGATTLEGSVFQGDLLAFANGQTMTGAYKAPALQPSPGTLTLAFSDGNNGVLSWPGGNMAIKRFEMVNAGLGLAMVANQPQSGWWWNEGESGRGYFIEWQGANAFLATYLYTASGSPTWYASQATTPDISRFTGPLTSYSGGQTLTGTYKPPSSTSTVGTVGISFTGPDTATLTWPGGTQVPIKRFRF